MADLDADILALAGDSSSDEGEIDQPTTLPKSESPVTAQSSSPPNSQKNDAASKPSLARKRTAKPSKSTGRVRKKARRDDSEEEGEASSAASSASSLDSAPMSESESEAEDMTANGAVTRFPVEGKFTSEADKAEILALPEIKREEILAERATEIEREQQNRMLIQLLRDKERQQNKEADKKKRKAVAAELDESQRKSSRQKTTLGGRKVGEASAPLEEYKRQREQREIYNEQRKRDGGKAADRSKDDYSDADAEGEDDVEWDQGDAARHSSAAREEQPAVIKDFDRVKVGRSNFAQVCFYPGFEEAITGCFVRINIGVDKATGQMVYRLASIKRFTEGKPYAIEAANGKRFVTSQYVLAAHGKAEKEWPFIVCSDSHITETEFERYQKVCTSENVPLPSKTVLGRKIDDINNLLNRSWTDAEIQEKLKRSGALTDRFAPLKRHELNERRAAAISRGDEAAIAKCDTELAALDGPAKLAFGTSLHASPPKVAKPPTQQERLAILNRANRKANTESVRKAQLAEKRAERINQAAIARGEAVANPFARVKTRAKVMHDVNAAADHLVPSNNANIDELFEGNSDRSRAGTPMSVGGTGTGTNTPKRFGTPRAGTPLAAGMGVAEKKPGLPTIRRRIMDDEVIGAIDLGIDIDIEAL